jgi:uncharacterized membrane protein
VAFPGAYFTAIKSISARGDMAGNVQDVPDGTVHGFLFHEGAYSKIDYPGAVSTEARGINNAGDLTGTYSDAAGRSFGFVLKGGTYHQIHVPNSSLTDVYQVQDNGVVMVGDAVPNSDRLQHGFLRSGPANFRLIDFPGTETTGGTVVRWINQRGDMVGGYGLNGYILRNGTFQTIDFPGAIATLPLAVNDDGTIVGIAVDTKGVFHGFKAVPQ